MFYFYLGENWKRKDFSTILFLIKKNYVISAFISIEKSKKKIFFSHETHLKKVEKIFSLHKKRIRRLNILNLII